MRSDAKKQQLTLLVAILLIGGGYIGVGAITSNDSSASGAGSGDTQLVTTLGPTSSVGEAATTVVETTSTTIATSVDVASVDATTTIVPGADVGATLPADPAAAQSIDLVGVDPDTGKKCVLKAKTLRPGDSGNDVTCAQEALITQDYMVGPASGVFDGPTRSAVLELQEDKGLYVDGNIGRETALNLGIWPDENMNVVRTPPPAEGAKDLLGYPLSSVASAGADAPPLPANSGEGRRIVFERAGQRAWAVDKDGQIVRSWLVSGSKYDNETPGTHKVYSKSEVTTAWNGKAFLEKMVRWLKTDVGAIGFHQIPVHRNDGTVYQTEAELGTRLSGGCQRQAKEDAEFLWDFAKIGTPVVVI
jgi:peptidoglycan hydrolase-like protein with peptidoglycan-binding domain